MTPTYFVDVCPRHRGNEPFRSKSPKNFQRRNDRTLGSIRYSCDVCLMYRTGCRKRRTRKLEASFGLANTLCLKSQAAGLRGPKKKQVFETLNGVVADCKET